MAASRSRRAARAVLRSPVFSAARALVSSSSVFWSRASASRSGLRAASFSLDLR